MPGRARCGTAGRKATLHPIAKMFDRPTRRCVGSWLQRAATARRLDAGRFGHRAWLSASTFQRRWSPAIPSVRLRQRWVGRRQHRPARLGRSRLWRVHAGDHRPHDGVGRTRHARRRRGGSGLVCRDPARCTLQDSGRRGCGAVGAGVPGGLIDASDQRPLRRRCMRRRDGGAERRREQPRRAGCTRRAKARPGRTTCFAPHVTQPSSLRMHRSAG